MTRWETWYWRVFNASVRVLGLVALWCGAVFIGWGARRVSQMEFIEMDQTSALLILPVGLLAAGIGWAVLRVQSYRPDLGDAWWRFDPIVAKTRRAAPKRTWWTGDRVAKSR
jgi:hypothetical protein